MADLKNTVTLPIKEFLEYFFAYKDKIVVDKDEEVYKELKLVESSHPNPELLFHIQDSTEKYDFFSLGKENLAAIWNPRDWNTAYTNHLRKKRESEEFALKWEMKKETEAVICQKISESIGLPATHAAVKGIAETIYNKRNRELAKAYGIELPSDEELRVGKFEIRGGE